MGQWLGFRIATERGIGLIPGQGTKILQAAWCRQKKKKEREGNLKENTNRILKGELYLPN